MSTKKSTCRKTAISVPREVLDAVDRAARERGESRSRFISRVLLAALRARRDVAITRRLNELFADDALADRDRRDAEELGLAATDWTNERW